MKSDRFYLACLRDNVGSNIGFHAKDGRGYVTDLDKAHVYTQEEAQAAWNRGREFDLPLCADRVDAVAKWRVDFQVIPSDSAPYKEGERYVGYKKGRWDGNDVFWHRENGASTTDFNEATVFSKLAVDPDLVKIPLDVAEKAKRRVLSVEHLDRRRMVQAAGMVTPEHIKRYKRRKGYTKTRFNCLGCGQIVWQDNPYDFEGCKNINCEEFAY